MSDLPAGTPIVITSKLELMVEYCPGRGYIKLGGFTISVLV
jgi:hypothetical protein